MTSVLVILCEFITSPSLSVSGVTGIEGRGEMEFVWHSDCGIGTASQNVLIPTLMCLSTFR